MLMSLPRLSFGLPVTRLELNYGHRERHVFGSGRTFFHKKLRPCVQDDLGRWVHGSCFVFHVMHSTSAFPILGTGAPPGPPLHLPREECDSDENSVFFLNKNIVLLIYSVHPSTISLAYFQGRLRH